MYNKILVPLDGSELAEVALPYAEELAGRMGSEVTVIHVHEPKVVESERIGLTYIQRVVDTTIKGAKLCSMKMGEGTEISVKSEILSGNPAEKLLEYVEKEKIDLIVMATHGQAGLNKWALGSIADKIVRAAAAPVFLIREKGSIPEPREKGILRKILIPLDGSANSEATVPYMEELATKLNVEVILLQALVRGYQTISEYVPLTEEELATDKASAVQYLDKKAAQFKNKNISVKTEIRLITQEGHAADEIVKFAGEIQADLIAMSTHGRSGLRRFVFGSVAEKILREGNLPLFLVKPKPSP